MARIVHDNRVLEVSDTEFRPTAEEYPTLHPSQLAARWAELVDRVASEGRPAPSDEIGESPAQALTRCWLGEATRAAAGLPPRRLRVVEPVFAPVVEDEPDEPVFSAVVDPAEEPVFEAPTDDDDDPVFGASTAEEDDLAAEEPWEDYDDLTIRKILKRLRRDDADASVVRRVRAYEVANKNRTSLIRELDEQLD